MSLSQAQLVDRWGAQEVSVFVCITPTGEVDPASMVLLGCPDADFAELVLKTLAGWRFEPGTQNEEPATYLALVQFQLATLTSSARVQ